MDIQALAAILTGRLLDHSARVVHPGRGQKGGAFPHRVLVSDVRKGHGQARVASMDAKVVLQ